MNNNEDLDPIKILRFPWFLSPLPDTTRMFTTLEIAFLHSPGSGSSALGTS